MIAKNFNEHHEQWDKYLRSETRYRREQLDRKMASSRQ